MYLAVKFTIFYNSLKYLTIFNIIPVFSVEVNRDCDGVKGQGVTHYSIPPLDPITNTIVTMFALTRKESNAQRISILPIFFEDSQAIAVGVMHDEIPPCKITEKRFLIVLPSHELF